MKHKKTFFFAALAAGCLFAPFHAEAEDAARAVTVHAPATVFIQGEPLKFTLKLRNPGEVKWSLLDWKDIELRSGMFAPDGTLALEALPNGYYKLKLSSSDAVFSGVRWIYPTYELQLPQESLKNANSIVFDVKVEPSDKVLFMLTMTVTQDEQGKFRTDHLRMSKPSGD